MIVKQHILDESRGSDVDALFGGLPSWWSSIAAGIHLYMAPLDGNHRSRRIYSDDCPCVITPPKDVQRYLGLRWQSEHQLYDLSSPGLQVIYAIFEESHSCNHSVNVRRPDWRNI